MAMGQGDCTIIKCPNGDILIVDMGSNCWEPVDPDNPKKAIYSPKDLLQHRDFLGNDKTIKALVFTHWDQDHYNKAAILTDDSLTTEIEKVYHSGSFENYKTGQANGKVRRLCKVKDGIRSIIYQGCQKQDALKKFQSDFHAYAEEELPNPNPIDITRGPGIDQYQRGQGVKIYDNSGCTIHILIGNLGANATGGFSGSPSAAQINGASIVLKLTYESKDYIICGDATGTTEAAVLAEYRDLKNVEVLQAPHHGSKTESSSSDDFVARMNPLNLVVSAPRQATTQPHPTCQTLAKYLSKPRIVNPTGKQDYGCCSKDCKSWEQKGAQARLFVTGWSAPQKSFIVPPSH